MATGTGIAREADDRREYIEDVKRRTLLSDDIVPPSKTALDVSSVENQIVKCLRPLRAQPDLADMISENAVSQRSSITDSSLESDALTAIRAVALDLVSMACSYAQSPGSERHIASDFEDFNRYTESVFEEVQVDWESCMGRHKELASEVVRGLVSESEIQKRAGPVLNNLSDAIALCIAESKSISSCSSSYEREMGKSYQMALSERALAAERGRRSIAFDMTNRQAGREK